MPFPFSRENANCFFFAGKRKWKNCAMIMPGYTPDDVCVQSREKKFAARVKVSIAISATRTSATMNGSGMMAPLMLINKAIQMDAIV
jgi:hypothetical protein